jgi:hypothetical protein
VLDPRSIFSEVKQRDKVVNGRSNRASRSRLLRLSYTSCVKMVLAAHPTSYMDYLTYVRSMTEGLAKR